MKRRLTISMILLAAAAAGATTPAAPVLATGARAAATAVPAVAPRAAVAGTAAPEAAELARLLNEFLAGANGAAVHEWFWADDLIYTGSGGRRVGKADILRDMASAPSPSPQDPVTVYSAEDVRIQQYGSTALVAFRLVGATTAAGVTRTFRFLNSGTFVKRGGRWQAVGWQATRLPLPPEEAQAQVAEAEARFHRASSEADTAAVAALLDPEFAWTDLHGERITRGQWLDEVAAGRVRLGRAGNESASIRVHGDAAVVRGRMDLRRSNPAGGPAPEAAGAPALPAVLDYTLTFVSAGGDWRAVALHTSSR